jgi:transcription antitermination factor NusG
MFSLWRAHYSRCNALCPIGAVTTTYNDLSISSKAATKLKKRSRDIATITTYNSSLLNIQIQNSNLVLTRSATSSTILNGKLWDKLQIDPDPMDEPPQWYLMNCVAGLEFDLLAQAKHVTRNLDPNLILKLTVPTERKIRSHGKTQNVVEMKSRYPGYVFCKMYLCPETYEPLQSLELCRSWMAGTVNQKGYRKTPPVPFPLSPEEVAKFKGLEEETDELYQKFGEDYTGQGDKGSDLLHLFQGYAVDNMVKVLTGNFKGEDGVVKRIREGEVMVRLYTYGNVMDQWFKMDEIRPMTDSEAMKGLTGPTRAINQDEFDTSIGKKKPRRDTYGTTRSDLMGSMNGDRRMRRQDRISRGEAGGKRDGFGRTEQEIKEEEENWRLFREEKRAEQQQRRGDMWGIKERSSWSGGESDFSRNNDSYKSSRQQRREKRVFSDPETVRNVQSAISGDDDWSKFAGTQKQTEEDDFFSSLMSELSDTFDSSSSSSNNKQKISQRGRNAKISYDKGEEEDFFSSLMSELSETIDDYPNSKNKPNKGRKSSSPQVNDSIGTDDDFFAGLEADLNQSLGKGITNEITPSQSPKTKNKSIQTDEDFFASLEADLNESLDNVKNSKEPEMPSQSLSPKMKNKSLQTDDDFFASLEADLNESLESVDTSKESKKKKVNKKNTSNLNDDLSNLNVDALKNILRERGLKVSGKKSELIERLQQS